MTTYGTMPSSSQPPLPLTTDLEFVSLAKARIKTGLATRRPWKEFFHLSSLNFPASSWDMIPSLTVLFLSLLWQTTRSIFHANYAIVFLTVLFLSLLLQPESLIVLVVTMVTWLFLYFLRDEPLVVLGRLIEEQIVLMGLLLGTVVALVFTHATENIIAALSTGFGVTIIHGALMDTSDMVLEEIGTPLGEAASDSYSLPYRLVDNHTDSNGTTV